LNNCSISYVNTTSKLTLEGALALHNIYTIPIKLTLLIQLDSWKRITY